MSGVKSDVMRLRYANISRLSIVWNAKTNKESHMLKCLKYVFNGCLSCDLLCKPTLFLLLKPLRCLRIAWPEINLKTIKRLLRLSNSYSGDWEFELGAKKKIVRDWNFDPLDPVTLSYISWPYMINYTFKWAYAFKPNFNLCLENTALHLETTDNKF